MLEMPWVFASSFQSLWLEKVRFSSGPRERKTTQREVRTWRAGSRAEGVVDQEGGQRDPGQDSWLRTRKHE